MKTDLIYEVVEQVSGGSGASCGRQFVACLTQEDILVFRDGRARATFADSCYTNVFIWQHRYEWSGFIDVTRRTLVRVRLVCFRYVFDK